ncbi:MAG TPA: hypothetical protein VFS90_03170 [Pyrinomonadaceae bacterium]|nr:hypothetical protein [Pyrinomonadaceae bacterium]
MITDLGLEIAISLYPSNPWLFFPAPLSPSTQTFIRVAYGVLMLGTLLWALPHWRRFFVSERWGGYAESSREIDFIQNPISALLVGLIWFAAVILLTLGYWTTLAALINLIFCYYFFVRMRWKGILRGMGAPGFMSYWLAAVVFLLEYALHHQPALMPLVLLVAQADFAFIMLSAGIYKFTAGYASNHGMEGGMVNPQWGYWWWIYQKISPRHPLFPFLNHMAWSLEVIAGVLMLLPPTRFIGALLMLGSFVFIATHIRLALLCEMVIVCCLLFFYPGSYGDQIISFIIPAAAVPAVVPLPNFFDRLIEIFLWLYLILLPLAHAGLFYNFYRRKSLPAVIQRALETYTNIFGIIIWRVFSADHTNFFLRVYERARASNERAIVSRFGISNGSLRYNHVAESIVLTTLFTTLKYYPSNNRLFHERLLRYARTVKHAPGSVLDFDYVSIKKADDRFEFVTVGTYTVDAAAGTIDENLFDPSFSVRATLSGSPVHEGMKPGSYVPLKS